jgi:hypothetical protein
MRLELLCPACGVREFDFDDYEKLVLLAPNLALMQFRCSRCGIHLSVTLKLTREMRHKVQQKLNAEAAPTDSALSSSLNSSVDSVIDKPTCDEDQKKAAVPLLEPSALSYAASLIVGDYEPDLEIVHPLRTASAELKAQLEYFKRQLDGIKTVDEAIEEIDTGYYHEKRDV